MARKRVVEALQFDFLSEVAEEVVETSPEPASPASRQLSPPGGGEAAGGEPERRIEGLRAARQALETGLLPDRGEASGAALMPEPGESSDSALGVGAFYERLRRAVRAGFPDEVWVTGEIRKVTVSKGHRYIELADHGEDEEAAAGRQGATLEVACWARDWPVIAARLDAVGVELAAGLVVRVRGRVSIWEAGARVRFSLSDLDVEALVGGIAAARRRLLAVLAAEGLLEANRRLPTPLVPLRVGLVTSAGSEAYRDFTGQLERSGFSFEVRLEASLVQGPEAPFQISRALDRLQELELDVVVLVRGGGAKGDLAAFDHEAVARAIASSRHPVWTGIGHTGDRSVADEIAQRALVTPTACGEAVVAGVAAYLDGLERRTRLIARTASRAMDGAAHELAGARSGLSRAARHELSVASGALESARGRAERGATFALMSCASSLQRRAARVGALVSGELGDAEHVLSRQRAMLGAFDPRRQLERGWSLTRTPSGRIVRSVGELQAGDELVSVLADGTVRSRVEQTLEEKPGGLGSGGEKGDEDDAS